MIHPLQKGVDLTPFCTFRVGGKARFFYKLSATDIIAATHFAKERCLPYFILGRGSNVLFDDKGFDGIVILNSINYLARYNGAISVGAGYSLPKLNAYLSKNNLSGLEFTCGIPGSLGGAIYMNAGVGKDCIEQTLLSVTYFDGICIKKEDRKNLSFWYRGSCFQKSNAVILQAQLKVYPSNDVKDKIKQFFHHRKQTQPYNLPSAGCIFRNTKFESAGALIERCGLKGLQIGGARVSSQHANFIVNSGNATAKDVLELMKTISATVYEKTKHQLLPEVCYVPFSL